jgi:hypothetical protein
MWRKSETEDGLERLREKAGALIFGWSCGEFCVVFFHLRFKISKFIIFVFCLISFSDLTSQEEKGYGILQFWILRI